MKYVAAYLLVSTTPRRPHIPSLAEIVPSHRGFWLLGFSNLPLSLVPQAQMGGKESPSEADVKAVLASGTSPITP